MNQHHFDCLERMYLQAKVNTSFYESTEIHITEKAAEISIEVSDKYFHALGAMHGSVYFKLLDDAAFFAVSSVVEDVFVLTTSFNIQLIRPVTEGKITAIGKLRFQSEKLFVAEAQLFNERGKEVAFGSGNFAKSKKALSETIGYL